MGQDDRMPPGFPSWHRKVTTRLSCRRDNFIITVSNSEETGEEDAPWKVTMADFDGHVGAIGSFPTERDVLDNIEGFYALAVPAFQARYAKGGIVPHIALRGEDLIMEIRVHRTWHETR